MADMIWLDAVREWFQRWEAVWIFLTAVGTILLAGVTSWLATRKPRVRLNVSVEVFRDDQAKVTITNVEESLPVLRTWYWRSPTLTPPRLDLPGIGHLYDGRGIYAEIPRRMEPGDQLVGIVNIRDLAQIVDPLIRAEATREEIASVSASAIGYMTTVGKMFEAPLPASLQERLAQFIVLRRTPI